MKPISLEQRKDIAHEAADKGRPISALLNDRTGANPTPSQVHDLEWANFAKPAPRSASTD